MNTQLVRNWMTPHPITITPRTTLPEAQQLMLDYHIRRLPVVDKDKLVGIVTRRDINRAAIGWKYREPLRVELHAGPADSAGIYVPNCYHNFSRCDHRRSRGLDGKA